MGPLVAYSQVSTIELVKILNNHKADAIYFYENNWKKFREKALEDHQISSYNLFINNENVDAPFDIILITNFADSIALQNSEVVFQKIINEIRPNGPLLLTEKKPNDFRMRFFNGEFYLKE